MSIPLIGQKPTLPPINVKATAQGGAVVLSTAVYGGVMVVNAPMGIDVATQVLVQLGAAIDTIAPGQLAGILKRWQRQLGAGPVSAFNGEDVDSLARGRMGR